MKLTKAQKARRIKKRLSFQTHCRHYEIEENKHGEWQCENCNKIFEKDHRLVRV